MADRANKRPQPRSPPYIPPPTPIFMPKKFYFPPPFSTSPTFFYFKGHVSAIACAKYVFINIF
jgi:hypothetical protein